MEGFHKVLRQTGHENFERRKSFRPCLGALRSDKKFQTSRNLMFERGDRGDNESLFEKILKNANKKNKENWRFISLIWTECELWRDSFVLTEKTPNGHLPIDFVIESQNDENLFAFLVFDFDKECETVANSSKHYFLKLKNEQYFARTGKTLFQVFYKMIDEKPDQEVVCLEIIEKLLKEMEQITDIQNETSINEVIEMKNEEYKHKILNLLISFWKPISGFSENYSECEELLSTVSPFYKLRIALKENKTVKFEEFFVDYERSLRSDESNKENMKADFNFFLQFALENRQTRAIEIVLQCELLDPNQVEIKANRFYDGETVHFFMLNLLKRGYFIGNNKLKGCGIPDDFLTITVLEEFLDSQVKQDGKLLVDQSRIKKIVKKIFLRNFTGIHGCKIDYAFLIDPKFRGNQITSTRSKEIMFRNSMPAFETLLNNERLQKIITHPSLASYITLKSERFNQIFKIIFFLFLIFYVVPFGTLIFFTLDHDDKDKVWFYLSVFYCLIAICCLTLKEIIQMLINFETYFKEKSNLFEIFLIFISVSLVGSSCIHTYKDEEDLKLFNSIAAIFIVIGKDGFLKFHNSNIYKNLTL